MKLYEQDTYGLDSNILEYGPFIIETFGPCWLYELDCLYDVEKNQVSLVNWSFLMTNPTWNVVVMDFLSSTSIRSNTSRTSGCRSSVSSKEQTICAARNKETPFPTQSNKNLIGCLTSFLHFGWRERVSKKMRYSMWWMVANGWQICWISSTLSSFPSPDSRCLRLKSSSRSNLAIAGWQQVL